MLGKIIAQSLDFRLLKQSCVALGTIFALGACSLDANIQALTETIDIENLNRKEPDFIHGEVVTSGQFEITGVFGEISEKTKAINNNDWEFEGVFYE
ncbi:MAG: hypothetical protein HUU57_03020 [Bdellovibrio sp.]|nr:hypothetical protein [Bdellovibrio sp.]